MGIENIKLNAFKDYFMNEPKLNEKKISIIIFCVILSLFASHLCICIRSMVLQVDLVRKGKSENFNRFTYFFYSRSKYLKLINN